MIRSRRVAADVCASLVAQKHRSLLMALGLAVGVAVLSATIVVGQGTEARIKMLVEKHGLDMLMVRAGGEVQVFAPQADRGLATLFEADARAIEADVPGVRLVSGVQNQRGITVVHEDRSVTTRAFGVEPDWLEIRHRDMGDGEFLTIGDMAVMGRVVMLGAKVGRELFPEGDAVGRTVRIANDPYTVKGVFIEMGVNAGGDDWDDRIVVPLTTSARRLFNRPYLEQIVIQVSDARRMPEIAERVRNLLRVRHSIVAGKRDDFFVREPEDVEDAALATRSTLSALSLMVALVALVAGGLVVMNLMLAAVSQRSHEIGLRRAIGARSADITQQFLLESLAVALVGGGIGVAMGTAIAMGLAALGVATTRVTWVPFAVAFASCALVGVAAGLHPARRAARVDPAATLRQGTA
jgi:putative ABC transport system permease protein